MVGSQQNLGISKIRTFDPKLKKLISYFLKRNFTNKMCALSESDIKINSFTSGFFLFYRNINLVKK
jgi:hypothetical protein